MTVGKPSVEMAFAGQLMSNSTSDTNVPSSVQGCPCAVGSVTFDARFQTPSHGFLDTCGGPAVGLSITASTITVGVPLNTSNGPVLIPVKLAVYSSFHYWFPGGFGTWFLDDLSGHSGLPGAGFAFKFQPC